MKNIVTQAGEIGAVIASNLIYITVYLGIVTFLTIKAPLPYTPLFVTIEACLISIFLIGSIFIYGNHRCQHPEFKDPLEKPLFDEKLSWLDGWAYTHFMAFFFISLFGTNTSLKLNKTYWPWIVAVAFGIGIAWEFFEHVVGKERPGWMGGYGGCNMATDKNEDGNWWYGKWTDLLLNGTGMILGIAFSMMLSK